MLASALSYTNGRRLTRRCTRRGAVRWPGTKVACLLATCTASRPLHLAPCGATISRGSGPAAQPLASLGAARVSARSVGRTEIHMSKFSRFSSTFLVFVVLASCGRLTTEPQDLIVQPNCSNPAPLYGANGREYPDRVVDDYFVTIIGSDVRVEGPRLATK